jgi:hypothetical protein
LEDYSVDIVIATPSVMQLYDPADYPNIKYVATAGEPCPKPLADRLAAAGVAYYNSCGPTEVDSFDVVARVVCLQLLRLRL